MKALVLIIGQSSQPISVSQNRFLRLAFVDGKLLPEHEHPQSCRPIEPSEDNHIEILSEHYQKQWFHCGSMESGHRNVQRDEPGWNFRVGRRCDQPGG